MLPFHIKEIHTFAGEYVCRGAPKLFQHHIMMTF